jgi:hypothetical protein
MDNTYVRQAGQRMSGLHGDALSLLVHTVDSYGTSYPVPREPLGCERVARPRIPAKVEWPRRAFHFAEMLGWLTPNERYLRGLLAAHTTMLLEERDDVISRQLGLVSFVRPDGVEVTQPSPALAESDASIAQRYPFLVRPELKNHRMAVAGRTLEQLVLRADKLKSWRPEHVTGRTLDPNSPQLVHSYASVIYTERRSTLKQPPDETARPQLNSGSKSDKPTSESIVAKGERTAMHPLTEDHERILAFLYKHPGRALQVNVIATQGPIRRRQTVGALLRDLLAAGLVYLPRGSKKEYALTDAGRDRAKLNASRP